MIHSPIRPHLVRVQLMFEKWFDAYLMRSEESHETIRIDAATCFASFSHRFNGARHRHQHNNHVKTLVKICNTPNYRVSAVRSSFASSMLAGAHFDFVLLHAIDVHDNLLSLPADWPESEPNHNWYHRCVPCNVVRFALCRARQAWREIAKMFIGWFRAKRTLSHHRTCFDGRGQYVV